MLQGSISVESKLGVGSTFTVRLPIKAEIAAISTNQMLTVQPDYLN
jgi:chemotaxis protein histidine kinase CheA